MTSADVDRVLTRARGVDIEQRRRAESAVVTDHLWLARVLAHRYRRSDEDADDLFQIACLGLVEAVHRFDPDLGEFRAFASATVTGVLKHHFRDDAWHIRPTRSSQELLMEMRLAWPRLVQDLGRIPSRQEMAEHLGVPAATVALADKSSSGYRAASLDVLTDKHGEVGRSDVALILGVEARLIVDRLLGTLDDDDRLLLWLRFYEERSQTDIALTLGTNQMQVSRRLARLLRRLRELVGATDG